MLKENKTLQYLLIVVSLLFLGIGYTIQHSKINTEKKIHLELTQKFKDLCEINQQNLTEYIDHKRLALSEGNYLNTKPKSIISYCNII